MPVGAAAIPTRHPRFIGGGGGGGGGTPGPALVHLADTSNHGEPLSPATLPSVVYAANSTLVVFVQTLGSAVPTISDTNSLTWTQRGTDLGDGIRVTAFTAHTVTASTTTVTVAVGSGTVGQISVEQFPGTPSGYLFTGAQQDEPNATPATTSSIGMNLAPLATSTIVGAAMADSGDGWVTEGFIHYTVPAGWVALASPQWTSDVTQIFATAYQRAPGSQNAVWVRHGQAEVSAAVVAVTLELKA